MELLPSLLRGAVITIQVFAASGVIAILIAFVVGLSRLSRFAIVRVSMSVYVEIFRGTSLLVQLFWFYFVLPFLGVELSAMNAAILALSLNYAAYASEIVRASILAVPKGQIEASIALNMTPVQRMRFIVLPQALRLMLPGFCNNLIEMLKATALVSLITLGDMTFQGMTLRNLYAGLTAEIFTSLLILYFLLALPLIVASHWLERRMSVGGA